MELGAYLLSERPRPTLQNQPTHLDVPVDVVVAVRAERAARAADGLQGRQVVRLGRLHAAGLLNVDPLGGGPEDRDPALVHQVPHGRLMGKSGIKVNSTRGYSQMTSAERGREGEGGG